MVLRRAMILQADSHDVSLVKNIIANIHKPSTAVKLAVALHACHVAGPASIPGQDKFLG